MTAQRGFRGRFIAWALVAILAAYCLFWGGAWAATYYADLRVSALIPAFAVVAVWVLIAIRRPSWRPRTVLAPAFAAAFVAFVLCTVTSRNPRFSVEYLALAILLAALYLILQRLMASPFFRPRMIGFTALAAIAIGVAYAAVTIPHWIAWWGLIGRIAPPPLRPGFESLTLGNPSAVLTASVLLTVPAVAYIAGGSRGRVIGALAMIALATAVTLVSGSRAGWLAVGFAVVVVGFLWLVAPERRASIMTLTRSRSARIAAVPVAIAALGVGVIAVPGFLARASAGGEDLRATYWAAAIRMFESSPLVGTGPGTWSPLRVSFTHSGEPDYYIPHAHNLYVQTLAEFGIVGVLAGLVVAFALGRLLLGAIRDTDPARRRMGWAALFTTVYFGAHQMLDFYANAPSILFAFAIPIAWLDATAPAGASLIWRKPATPRWMIWPWRRLAGLAGVAAIVMSGAYLAWSESGAALMQGGTAKLDALHVAEAVAPLEAAVKSDPAMPPYQVALGLALADTGDLVGAEAHFLAAANVDNLPATWLNVAAVRARLGDMPGAQDALVGALRLGDQQSLVAIGAGFVEMELGKRDAAAADFSTALLLSPSLAGDPWWTSDPARAEVWPIAYQLAFEQAGPSVRFALALEKGDTAGATQAIANEDREPGISDGLILASWSGDRQALSELEARARARPFDAYVVNWLARIYSRLGNKVRSADYGLWSNALLGQSNFEAPEVRVAQRPTIDNVAGSLSVFHGHYAYRRPLPHIQLVSWLPQLIYE